MSRVLPHREATAVPACHFGTAAFVHALITSPLRGEAVDFEATPPNFLKATACSLQVVCHFSCFVCLTNDPTVPCPPRSAIGAATSELGQLYTLQLPGNSELGESLNVVMPTCQTTFSS